MMYIKIALTALALVSIPAFADGPDQQSPEEIAAARQVIARDFKNAVTPNRLSKEKKKKILAHYAYLDPKHEVPQNLLEEVVLYFDQNLSAFPNTNYISVVDYGKKSDTQRFFVINMATGAVDKFWTIHGWGSDLNEDGLAESFGNVLNSGKSSVGFVRTAEVYIGTYKRAVRLDGLSSTNSNVRERAIVVHGWNDVHEKPVKQGLGWGCPALDWNVKDGVIDKIAEGSLMYFGVAK